MTQRVDHEERRHRIAEALWRIVGSRGLDDVGLREIAGEAGMSLGQLQHYFRSKDELLVFALDRLGRLTGERVRSGLEAAGARPSPFDVVRATVRELLPLTARSRTGLLVHIAFLARAVHDDALRELTRDGLRPLTALLAEQIRRAVDTGDVPADRDPDTEATVLVALAEGLTNYTLLDAYPPGHAEAIMDGHLGRLFPAAGGTPTA